MDQITISREDFRRAVMETLAKPDGIVGQLTQKGAGGGLIGALMGTAIAHELEENLFPETTKLEDHLFPGALQ